MRLRVLHGCTHRRLAGGCSHPPVRDQRVVRGMTEVLVGREPVSEAVRRPLIELVGVEKVYRAGKVEFPALRGVDLSIADG